MERPVLWGFRPHQPSSPAGSRLVHMSSRISRGKRLKWPNDVGGGSISVVVSLGIVWSENSFV